MFARLDELLRSRGRHAVGIGSVPWQDLTCSLLAAGALFGAIMGTWSGRAPQIAYSAIKVPLLMTTTSAVCLPCFFVVNTILGLRDDFLAACRGLLSAQATLAIVLAALAPLTAFVYVSGCSYPTATMTNGGVFLTATICGQYMLARHYRPLLAKDARHIFGLGTWLLLYVFVAIQLAWSLRPFIGWPEVETSFLRADSWTNAYVDAVRAMRAALGR